MARAEAAYGVPMLEAYGMTEASHEMAANPLPPAERRDRSGRRPDRLPDPHRRTPTGATSPPGAQGEVVVSGPGVTPGYLANPGGERRVVPRRVVSHRRPQGMLEDGYLRLVGRIKELIIRGGENISPAEVEDVLRAHPAVADAAVFGIPDEKYGEVVAAAVAVSEPVSRATTSPTTAAST